MSFDLTAQPARKIAIIGGGISGLGAAHLLCRDNRVTLFEAEPRLGGHARTVLAGQSRKQPVDTGFIVFNYANYPHLTALFEELGVPVTKSNMSFGASVRGGRLEYGLASLGAIFAQHRRAFDLRYLRMLRDIAKFNAEGLALAHARPDLTIGGFLEALGTGNWFRDYYLTPLSGAIWSTPTEQILEFPAWAMMQFFENHALLSYTGQHQWYTVEGGSREYVTRLEAHLRAGGADLRLSAPVDAVRRVESGVEIKSKGACWEHFDAVIMATHSDDTLHMLSDASAAERKALSKIAYQPNAITLHADASIMPKRKAVWSSWNYCEPDQPGAEQIDLTYWMNSLQPIPANDPLFVTLNSARPIREELIYDQVTLRHPVYDLGALQGQQEIAAMNGARNTWFCGAWMKNGFHEDGLSSAVDVVEAMRSAASLGIAAQ